MNDSERVIRIEDLICAVIKSRILILIATLVGLFLGIILSIVSYLKGEMSREYAIKTSIAVTSVNEDGLFTGLTNDPNSSDIHLAEDMVDAVIYVMKSDMTLNKAIDDMDLVGVSAQDIYRNLTMAQYNETQIIEMTLYWRSAEEGVAILDAINRVSPGILIETLKIGNVAIVNTPTAKYRLGGSINARLWIITMLAGAALGMGFAVLRMLIVPTITNAQDVKTEFNLDVLGEIPDNKEYFARKGSILAEDPDYCGARVREEFASSAHILLYRLGEGEHKCAYVTSAEADEGKTNVTAHLGVQLSALGKKVLMVDFDFRNPSLGTAFLEKVDYAHSINALYRGEATIDEAITTLTGNLDILPAILERRELPFGDAMTQLIQGISHRYDIVLMDAAPIGKVADSMNLNRITKDAIFVVRYDHTSHRAIREALSRLDKTGVSIKGCIVNRVKSFGPVQRDKYYKRGYHYHETGQPALPEEV